MTGRPQSLRNEDQTEITDLGPNHSSPEVSEPATNSSFLKNNKNVPWMSKKTPISADSMRFLITLQAALRRTVRRHPHFASRHAKMYTKFGNFIKRNSFPAFISRHDEMVLQNLSSLRRTLSQLSRHRPSVFSVRPHPRRTSSSPYQYSTPFTFDDAV